jgi:Protein of unknown function (DUF1091)
MKFDKWLLQVHISNYVKLSKGPFKPFGFKVTLDVCAIVSGGRHPIIKTFMGPDIYEEFEKVTHTCPYGVRSENFLFKSVGI